MELALYIGVTTALVELIKHGDFLPSRFYPIVSLLVGASFGYFAGFDWLNCLVIGLSASGFYSAQKTVRGL